MRVTFLSLVLGLVASPAFGQGLGGDLERSAASSPQEKLTFAAEANEEMRDAIKNVSKLLETARKESNVERLQCLNTRITSVRALLQVSEAAEVEMRDALNGGDTERADHEFRKVAVARTKSQQLLAEANRCADDTGLRSGETSVKWEGGLLGREGESEDTEGLLTVSELDLGFDPIDGSPFTTDDGL